MNKFIEWFNENNILRVCRYDNDETYGMYLFKIWFDFRKYYKIENNKFDFWYDEYEKEVIIKEHEKRNKKRKNKLEMPIFYRLSWYRTITNWNSLWCRSRNYICFSIGFVLGCVIKGLI